MEPEKLARAHRAGCVHWEHQNGEVEEGTRQWRRKFLSSSSDRLRGALEPSWSAAATLNTYLADALQDSGGPSRRRRRRPSGLGTADFRQVQDMKLTGESNAAEKWSTEPELPTSPLSRFLCSVHQIKIAPPASWSGESFRDRIRFQGRSVDHDSTARTCVLRLTNGSAGSMERLLREKISEAKSMREVIGRPKDKENQPPNAAKIWHISKIRPNDSELMEEPRQNTATPVPHSKPLKPQLTIFASQRLPQHPPPIDYSTRYSAALLRNMETPAVMVQAPCRIQRMWRKRVPQRQADESVSGRLAEDAGILDVETTQQSLRQPLDPTLVGQDDGAQADVSIQTDAAVPLEMQVGDSPYPSMESTEPKSAMWHEDDWSFLEEGRYASCALLDSPAPEEDSSVEGLVRTKPHIVAQVQEARRVQQARRRRTFQQHDATISVQVLPADSPPIRTALTRKVSVRVPVRIRHLRKRVTTCVPSHGHVKMNRRTPIKIALCQQETTGSSLEELAGNPSEPRDSGENQEIDTEVVQSMLEQLNRYVVFSDIATGESDPVESRNDLITVASLVEPDRVEDSSGDRNRLSPQYEGNVESVEQKNSNVGEKQETPNGFKREEASTPTPSATETPSHDTHTGDPFEEQASSGSLVSTRSASQDVELLFPALRQVELEVKRTLVRIQSQYAYEQQQTLTDADAAADDAYLSIFLSPARPPCRPSAASAALSRSAFDETSPSRDSVKQQEFLFALDSFKQSLRASRSSSRRNGRDAQAEPVNLTSPHSALGDEDELSDEEASAGHVDDEFQMMLDEIQNCKQQIAAARQVAAQSFKST